MERLRAAVIKLLDAFPAPVYTTDAAGRITFYNEAAVKFSGRQTRLGTDQWCVTWRLYWPDGTPLPHDECPMAIALKEDRAVRGARAVAERLDGTRVPFIPHPTPLRDASGALVGAVNMLLEIDEVEQVALDGVQMLIVSADIFVAAELDLLIDEAGGVAVANRAPSDQVIAEGDIMSLDSGGNYRGYIGDLCRMGILGEPDAERHRSLIPGILVKPFERPFPSVRLISPVGSWFSPRSADTAA